MMATSLPRRALVPLMAISLLLFPRAAAADGTVVYEIPVEGEVATDFETPAHHYAAGHRGIDLAVGPGTPVAAAGAGVVHHAGQVGGTTWVSIRHQDGVITSYGPLSLLRVAEGDAVAAGDPLGVVAASTHGAGGGGLHWGARRDGVYLDPLSLLEPILVPSLVGPGAWRGTHHVIEPVDRWEGGHADGWLVHGSPAAEGPRFGLPPNPNHLVVVAGLNSATDDLVIDPSYLGYGDSDASRFSYAGLDDAGNPLPYDAPDTWAGIDAAARRLADQLRQQQRDQPSRAVDLLGHSQGGVVILHYLANHHDPYDPTLPPIGNVVTFASPHRGADLANLVRTARDDLVGGAVGAVGAYVADPHGKRFKGAIGTPISEFSVGSDVLGDLAQRFEGAVEAGTRGPFATGTRVLTIGAAGDLLVPTHRARAPGVAASSDIVLDPRVLPGGHEGVLRTRAAHEVVHDFLSGDEPVSSPGRFATGASRVAGDLWRLLGETYALVGFHKAMRDVAMAGAALDADVPVVAFGDIAEDPWRIGTSRAPDWWPDPFG